MIITGVFAAGALAAWLGHTDQSRELTTDLDAAFAERGFKHGAAVRDMGLTNEPQLSRQLAGSEPLNMLRFASLPDDVKLAFYRRQVCRLGGVVLDATQASLLRGAAALGAKRMAKMAGEQAATERRRA